MASLNNVITPPNSYFSVVDGGEASFKNGKTERNLGTFTYESLNYNVYVEAQTSRSGSKDIVLQNGIASITRIQEVGTKNIVPPGSATFNSVAQLALPVVTQLNPQARNYKQSNFSSAFRDSVSNYKPTQGIVSGSATLRPYGGFTGVGNNIIGAGVVPPGANIFSYPTIFPSDMDRMKLDVYEYTPRGARNNARGQIAGTLQRTIYLPIPKNLLDQNSVNWQQASIGEFGETILGAALQATKGDVVGALGQLGSRAANALKDEKIRQAGLAAVAINSLGGNVSLSQILGYTTGAILNPNVELMFTGVNLRTFTFQFDLYPQNAAEGLGIRNIIGYLKSAMAPKVSQGDQNYIKVPFIFQPVFLKGESQPHPGLGLIKICALKDMSVNYNGDAYSTFIDGTMQKYSMTLTLTEMETLYDEDYTRVNAGQGGVIGF